MTTNNLVLDTFHKFSFDYWLDIAYYINRDGGGGE